MIRRIRSRRFEARKRRPLSDYHWLSKYPVLGNLVEGSLTDMEMEMLNRIVRLVIEAANELEEHKNDEAYNGTNAYEDGTVSLHAVGNLLKNGDEIVKFAKRLGRASLYGMF